MILVLMVTYTGTCIHVIRNVKLKQSLCRPVSDRELPRSLRLPGFETVDT